MYFKNNNIKPILYYLKMGKNKNKKNNLQPFVSVCTPTFNRRPFINQMIRCFDIQDYPKDKLEWIIILLILVEVVDLFVIRLLKLF